MASPYTPQSELYVPGEFEPRAPRGADTESSLPGFLESSMESIERYARDEPWAFAGWVFGIGFILGWKLKPW
ncbi:MAG: DUF883 C-terminal domain-containing protein [Isosphaeraceae bacterium]